MNLNRMKWLAIAMPLAFILFLRITTEGALGGSIEDWPATAIFFGALAVGVFFFATVVFGWLDRSQKASEARARELQALNDLGKALTGSLDRDAIVTVVLETAKDLLDARAVAISMHETEETPTLWRALGEGKSDLARAAAEMKLADVWERGSSHVLTDDGHAAILMSAPMVRALLAGVKTQTRRIVKPLRTANLPDSPGNWKYEHDAYRFGALVERGDGWTSCYPLPRAPYGVPGDRL